MKSTCEHSIRGFLFLVLAAGMPAQEPNPREEFHAAVAAFQRSAAEESLRKLAHLRPQLDPPPVVPDDARLHALKGAEVIKQAADVAAFAKAAGEFRAAIAIAPWVGAYHYNLAVCEKSAGRFPAALAALRFASILARDAKESDDCLALRAEVEVAQELAAARMAESDRLEGIRKAEALRAEQKKAVLRKLQDLFGDRPLTLYYGSLGDPMADSFRSYNAGLTMAELNGTVFWRVGSGGYFCTISGDNVTILRAMLNFPPEPLFIGTPNGPGLGDMIWRCVGEGFTGRAANGIRVSPKDRPIWYHLDEDSGKIQFSDTRPVSDREASSHVRYGYLMFKPQN